MWVIRQDGIEAIDLLESGDDRCRRAGAELLEPPHRR